MGKDKLLFFLSYIGIFLLGGLIAPFISSFTSNLFDKIKENGLLGNMVDLIGSIVVACMSAIIAYIVSNSQAKKHNERERISAENESKTYFRMLIIELGTHKTLIENIVSNPEVKYETCIKELQNLRQDVWEKYADRLHADSETLEKLYKYYVSLSSLKDLSDEELKNKEKNYLQVHIDQINKAIDYLNKNTSLANAK